MIYKPKAYFRDDYSDAMTADEIIIENDYRINTGILDEYGNTIYKIKNKEPFGFHHHLEII